MEKVTTNLWLGGAATVMALVAVLATLPGNGPGLPDARSARASIFADNPYPAATTATVIPGARRAAADVTLRFAAPLAESAHPAQTEPEDAVHEFAVDPPVLGLLDPGVAPAFVSTVGQAITFAQRTERGSIEAVRSGRVTAALIGGELAASDFEAGLCQTPIGVELFALAVRSDFPLTSLTQTEMRRILTGETTDWRQVGCDCGAIAVLTPADEGLAKRATSALIHGDRITRSAVRVVDELQLTARLERNPGAIAIVRVGSAPPRGSKILQIDWVSPTPGFFWSRGYPFGTPVHMVTLHPPIGLSARFLSFSMSDDGRELLSRSLLLR